MGTGYLLVVDEADVALLDGAEAAIADLERRWSRFLPDSEISVLNRCPDRPVIVSPDTFAVVRAAVDGSIATGGRFDPTVHDSLLALGYDRTFAEIDATGSTPDPRPAPGVAGVHLDESLHAVTLDSGVRLDLGGIGKGAAADIVSGAVMDAGAAGVAVSIGGDVRVRGASPARGGWRFTDDRDAGLDLPVLHDGGVCTSTVTRRRWTTAQGTVHHVVDPRTGEPTSGTVESITVVGATAQQAEVLTKAAMVAGDGAEAFLEPFGVCHHVVRRAAA